MKQYIVLLALAIFTAIGCSNPASDAPTSNKASFDPMAAGGSTDPIISYTTVPAVPVVGQSCTVIATMQQSITGTSAKLVLFQSANGGGSYNQVNGGTQGAQSVSYTFIPTAAGQFYFKVHFVKGSSNYSNNFDYFFTVPVIPKPQSSTIPPKITQVSCANPVKLSNGNYKFSVRYQITTYADALTNTVLTSTLVLGATTDSYSVAPASAVGDPLVITWNIGSMNAASTVLRTVTFEVPQANYGASGPYAITSSASVTADDFVFVPVTGINLSSLPQ
jgi:hypothetical protein